MPPRHARSKHPHERAKGDVQRRVRRVGLASSLPGVQAEWRNTGGARRTLELGVIKLFLLWKIKYGFQMGAMGP